MGTFSHTGQLLHGRMVYRHQTRDQHIFYIYGEFDGWLLGRSEMSTISLVSSPQEYTLHNHL